MNIMSRKTSTEFFESSLNFSGLFKQFKRDTSDARFIEFNVFREFKT
jgi:hypothetical protein